MHVAYQAPKTCTCIPCSANLYVIFKFLILAVSYKHASNLNVYYVMFVPSFLDYYLTYCYNGIFSVFSGAQLGCAPARRFFLRKNP